MNKNETKKAIPQMDSAIEHIESLLLAKVKDGRNLKVLEWGSGTSTAYFVQFLRDHKAPHEWISIEYDADWHGRVKEMVGEDPNVHIVLFPTDKNDARKRSVPMDDYVEYPHTLGHDFDLIIVDGRKRRRCLLVAKDILKPDGAVFLHDAFRPYYWSALKNFPDSRFISEGLWCGRIQPPTFSTHLSNIATNVFIKTHGLLHFAKKRILLKLRRIF